MENLLSGFLGAIIALFLTVIFSRYSNAARLNRIRKAIITYLEFLATPKLKRYISDSNMAIQHLQKSKLTAEDKGDGYDDMPGLTSEVLKSFPHNDLFIACGSAETYSFIIDSYYAVEFLKNSMPRKIYNEFSEWTNNHLEDKKIPAGDAQFIHITTCSAIARERESSIRNIEMKISTATGLIENFEFILKRMKGNSIYWKCYYFLVA